MYYLIRTIKGQAKLWGTITDADVAKSTAVVYRHSGNHTRIYTDPKKLLLGEEPYSDVDPNVLGQLEELEYPDLQYLLIERESRELVWHAATLEEARELVTELTSPIGPNAINHTIVPLDIYKDKNFALAGQQWYTPVSKADFAHLELVAPLGDSDNG